MGRGCLGIAARLERRRRSEGVQQRAGALSSVSDQKLFISYRWTTPDHVDWVLNLATALRGDGIDVKLDQWDLKPGHDALKFMEEMVTDEAITKVLIVSDRSYAERANQRQGGVGIEAQIISKKVYESTKQEKFAAIVLELDDHPRLLETCA